jgi:O-antigen ligase
MPPIIALTLTVVFILFLLYLERKQNPSASLALWIPSLWLLLVSCKALGVWTGTGEGMEEGSAIDRVVLSVLFVLGLLILLKRNFNWAYGITSNRALIFLIAFMFLSTLWSDMPLTALKRWFREAIIPIVMAFVVSTEANPRQALMSVFRRIIYVHMPLSLLLIKYYTELGVQYGRWDGAYMWIGVATQKNGLVLLCVFALFVLFWTLLRRWRDLDIPATRYQIYLEVFVIMLSIWLFCGPNHVLTYSSTSTASLTIGLAALLCLLRKKLRAIALKINILPVFIAFIIFYGTLTPFAGGFMFYNPSGLLGRDETLTGRTDVWQRLIPYAMENIFFGRGYASFWNEELRATIESHAHNGYLDMILNTGLAGLMFWAAFLIASCHKAQQEMRRDPEWGVFWFCIILMAVIHNIGESSMISFVNLMPAVIVFLNASLQAKKPLRKLRI